MWEENEKTLSKLARNKRGAILASGVAAFIIVAIAIVLGLALAGAVFQTANKTGGSYQNNTVGGAKWPYGGTGSYGNVVASASTSLLLLVGFVFVAAIIVWVVRQLIE